MIHSYLITESTTTTQLITTIIMEAITTIIMEAITTIITEFHV